MPRQTKAPLGLGETANATAIETFELAQISARAEARLLGLHYQRMDKVVGALVESITDASRRSLAAEDDQWAMAHKAMLDELVGTYLRVVRPESADEFGVK